MTITLYKIKHSFLSAFVGVLFISFTGMAQQTQSFKEQLEERESHLLYQQTALKEFVDNGVLLVRIRSFQNEITYWERIGGEEGKAGLDRTAKKVAGITRALKAAFQQFDLCPVYFYYTNDAKAVMHGDYSKLLGGGGDFDRTRRVFHLDSDHFPSASMSSSINGFGVFNDGFQLLSKPFPSTVRKFELFAFLGADRSYSEMVEILQRKIKEAHAALLLREKMDAEKGKKGFLGIF